MATGEGGARSDESAPGGILGAMRGIGPSLVALFRTRVELFGIELADRFDDRRGSRTNQLPQGPACAAEFRPGDPCSHRSLAHRPLIPCIPPQNPSLETAP